MITLNHLMRMEGKKSLLESLDEDEEDEQAHLEVFDENGGKE